MKAAVFDSGVGGLTVAGSLVDAKLFDEIIYYGDTARVPYGTKDPNTIIRYALEALEFFDNFDVEMLIVACNSVSAHALPALRERAKYPVVGVIEPGVLSLKNLGTGPEANVLVIGTRATVESKQYQRLIEEGGLGKPTAWATPLLVPLVEEGIYDGPIVDAAFEHYFTGLADPEVLILGCTHFPLLAGQLQRYFRGAKLIHSGDAIVEYLKSGGHLPEHPVKGETKLKIFASENAHRVRAVADRWMKRNEGH